MYICPHCEKLGISGIKKLCSVSFAPATCQFCGKRSYLHIMHGLMALITWIILTWLFIGLALFQQMSIYLIGTFPALVLAVDKCMLGAPMRQCPS